MFCYQNIDLIPPLHVHTLQSEATVNDEQIIEFELRIVFITNAVRWNYSNYSSERELLIPISRSSSRHRSPVPTPTSAQSYN